jgi:hypothetical protein
MGPSYIGHFTKQKKFNCIVIMAYKLLISRYINHQLSYFAQGLETYIEDFQHTYSNLSLFLTQT